MNNEIIYVLVFMFAWLIVSLIKRELIENNKKIIVIAILILIIFSIYFLPNSFSNTMSFIGAGCFMGEGVIIFIKKIFNKTKKENATIEKKQNQTEIQEDKKEM